MLKIIYRLTFIPWAFWNKRKSAAGFPCGSTGKESTCNSGELDSVPGMEKSPGEGKGYPLQYSGLKNNSTDCIVLGVAESDTIERFSLSLSL